jgi:hypothetical protein
LLEGTHRFDLEAGVGGGFHWRCPDC